MKKLTPAKPSSAPPAQQLSRPNHPSHPPVVQPQTVAASRQPRRPVAPPVYRPQPMPEVLQRKTAGGQPQPAAPTRPRPEAPPAYRPQPTPKVLQRKVAGPPPHPASTQPSRTPCAPSAYRPQPAGRALQRNVATTQPPPATTKRASHVPHVNRPGGALQLRPAGHNLPKAGPAMGAASVVQLFRVGEETNTIYATLDEIQENPQGLYITYNNVRYRVDGIVRKSDYSNAGELLFKLSSYGKIAKYIGPKKSQEDLGLDDNLLQEKKLKTDNEAEVKKEIAACQITVYDSAYRHNRNGDGNSKHVGDMSNQETNAFITNCLTNTMVNNIKYVSAGKNGGHSCVINLDQAESIAFECKIAAKEANVFHVGPGGK